MPTFGCSGGNIGICVRQRKQRSIMGVRTRPQLPSVNRRTTSPVRINLGELEPAVWTSKPYVCMSRVGICGCLSARAVFLECERVVEAESSARPGRHHPRTRDIVMLSALQR